MKKRLIIGLVVGATVFAAVFAMAASLGVASDDLGAGNSVVASCDDSIDVSYTTAFDDATDDRYEVTEVVLKNVAAGCEGQALSITLMKGTTSLLTETGTISLGTGTTHTESLTTPQSAKDVDGVHVVISG